MRRVLELLFANLFGLCLVGSTSNLGAANAATSLKEALPFIDSICVRSLGIAPVNDIMRIDTVRLRVLGKTGSSSGSAQADSSNDKLLLRVDLGTQLLRLKSWASPIPANCRIRVYLEGSIVSFATISRVDTSEQLSQTISTEGWSDVSGLPETVPSVSLVTALERHRFGSPLEAKLVVARYALYSCGDMVRRPSWIIMLFDVPSVLGPRVDGSDYTDWYTVIDAETGELIYTSNKPCRDILESKEGIK